MCWIFNGVSSEQFQRWRNVQTLSKLWLQRFLQKVGKILVVEVSRALNRSISLHTCSSTFPTGTNLFSHPPVVRTVPYRTLRTNRVRVHARFIVHPKTGYDAKERLVGRSRTIQSCTDGKRTLNRSL
jgi:hypothetical protein